MRICDERCGIAVSSGPSSEQYRLVVAKSKLPNAGMGLFAGSTIPSGKCIGRFGGTIECGLCVRSNRKEREKSFDVLLCDVEYGEHNNDIMWHFVRSYDVEIDGTMWFINSCCLNKDIQGTANVKFESAGLTPGENNAELEPLIEVVTCCEIESGAELLASYGQPAATGSYKH